MAYPFRTITPFTHRSPPFWSNRTLSFPQVHTHEPSAPFEQRRWGFVFLAGGPRGATLVLPSAMNTAQTSRTALAKQTCFILAKRIVFCVRWIYPSFINTRISTAISVHRIAFHRWDAVFFPCGVLRRKMRAPLSLSSSQHDLLTYFARHRCYHCRHHRR